MGNHIICIGREFGSGGHQIALLLGQKLGLKVYEKDILHMACKYGELQVRKMEAADEKAANPYLYETIHEGNYHVLRGAPTSVALFALQSHEIKRIAGQESCIMVGRCADHVLKDTDAKVLSVFISAPTEIRIQREMEQESLSHLRAKSIVRKMDLQRKKYYEHYTGKTWGKPGNYDLHIDTERTSFEEAAERIAARYKGELV